MIEQLKALLNKHNIQKGCKLSFEEYTAFMKDVSEQKFGSKIEAVLIDCFEPDGQPVDPGYEDSLDTYWFDVDWEELVIYINFLEGEKE